MPEERQPIPSEPCPSWCDVDHDAEDRFGNPVHHELGIDLPVVSLFERGDDDRHEQAVEVVLGRRRRVGDFTTWVYIGAGEGYDRQYLQLSLESAQRLAVALSRHLGV